MLPLVRPVDAPKAPPPRGPLPGVSSPSALDRPIPLAELLAAEALDEVIRSYADFHGVGVALVDPEGRALLSAGGAWQLCEVMRGHAAGRERCDAKLLLARTICPPVAPRPA